MDLAPTFLELAGAVYPSSESISPMRGESINDFLAGKVEFVHNEDYITVHSHGGRSLIRKGQWKLTNLNRPFDEADLELFNLEEDPGETTNLAETEPDKFQEMLELWRVERKAQGIVLPQDL
jgi:arylsulfatase